MNPLYQMLMEQPTAGNASYGAGYEPDSEDEHNHAGDAESSTVCQTTVSGYS